MLSNQNIITNWSYDKPTQEGHYLCCFGDVETHNNVIIDSYEFQKGALRDREGLKVSSYSRSYKFAKLVFSPTEIRGLK